MGTNVFGGMSCMSHVQRALYQVVPETNTGVFSEVLYVHLRQTFQTTK